MKVPWNAIPTINHTSIKQEKPAPGAGRVT